jgi:AcrR family transcriptional regulator
MATEKKYASGIVSRDNILLAARKCFAQRGFFETSMTDIEKAANTSRGVLYHHFESKDEMILAIISENLGNFADKIEADLEIIRTTGDGDLKQLLTNALQLVEKITMGPGRAMSVHAWSLSLLRPDVKVFMVGFFERIRAALKLQLVILQKYKKIDPKVNLDDLSTALFSIQIPAFIVQRLFIEDHSLTPEAFANSLAILFKPPTK